MAHYIDKFMTYNIPVSYCHDVCPNEFDVSETYNNIESVVTHFTNLFYLYRCAIFMYNRLENII